jgi:uncharacterized membrane protein
LNTHFWKRFEVRLNQNKQTISNNKIKSSGVSMKKYKAIIWIVIISLAYIASIIIYGFVVRAYFWGADGNLTQSGLYGDMFGAFNAFFTGLAFVGVLIILVLQYRDKHNDEIHKYYNCLTATKYEIEFYKAKIEQLSGEVTTNITALQNSGTANNPVVHPVFPTYRFYPNFLENQKIELSKFHFNSDLVKEVGTCHFELSHALSRLDFYITDMKSLNQQNAAVIFGNSNNFVGMLNSVANTFGGAITKLTTEIESINH